MIAAVPAAHATLELSHDFDTLQQSLEAFFSDPGQFEGFLKEQQRTWDDPGTVVRVIATHNVTARLGLTTEAVDGLVRVELESGARANWRFYYLKEGGLSTPPYEDFWIEPLGDEHA